MHARLTRVEKKYEVVTYKVAWDIFLGLCEQTVHRHRFTRLTRRVDNLAVDAFLFFLNIVPA
jgi:hypothetical protein